MVSSSFYQPQRDSYRSDSRQESRYDRNENGYRGPAAVTASAVDFDNPQDAEAAFNKLLKRTGVQLDWTWEQTMRATILDPMFRAIKDASARKDAFSRYIDNLKIEEEEKEKDRVAKFKVDFRNMLARHSDIKHYTRWKTALPLIESEPSFTASDNDEEKQKIFRDYIAELRKNYTDKRYQDHEEAMKELSDLVKEIAVSPDIRWAEAQKKLHAHPTFVNDEKYQTLTKSEVLDAFVNQIRAMWDEVNTIKQREKQQRGRTARKAREAFKAMLRDMQDNNQIGPETQWKQIYGQVKDDARYTALIQTCHPGESKLDGSTPQDIFFDIIEDLDYEVDDLRNDVDKALRDMRFTFDVNTTEQDFLTKISSAPSLKTAPQPHLKAVYKKLQAYATEHQEEIARERKRQQRKLIDLLRSRIKRLEPPVKLDDTWDQVRARVEQLPEYTDLDADEDRRAAYDKHMLRLQDDAERDRVHRAERTRRRGSSNPPRAVGDAYEADRIRAVEQRERLYGRGDGNRRESRDDGGGGGGARYDRERRERDAERERAYISRADPHAKTADLDYGDDGSEDEVEDVVASAKRDRRPSGSDTGRKERASKRARTDDDKDVDQDMQAGSEDGEIEEVVDGK